MPGLPVLLFLVFLVLKLTGVIAWSWLWITAPIWIPVIFTLGAVACAVVVGVRAANRVE